MIFLKMLVLISEKNNNLVKLLYEYLYNMIKIEKL